MQILGSVESIEAYLDDHLVKTQTMRGSPYFKPFEKEVLGWEAQLTRIQDTILAWLSVQEKWLYLEPILTVEEIVRHLPSESLLFREVDGHWKTVMENIAADPRVLQTAGVEGMLEMLQRSLGLLKDISLGLSRQAHLYSYSSQVLGAPQARLPSLLLPLQQGNPTDSEWDQRPDQGAALPEVPVLPVP